jgi:hypothetical protein
MARPFRLDAYLAGLSKEQRHEMLLAFMGYPRTADMTSKDSPACACNYTCTDKTCDFGPVKECIKESVELRSFGATEVVNQFVEDIDAHQLDHIAHRFDGFRFFRSGYELVRISRIEKGQPVTGGRTGIIEYNELRARGMDLRRAEVVAHAPSCVIL